MSQSRKLISIVIPAYNEELNINQTYEGVSEALPKNYLYEIIFVNDGSNDGTAEIIRKINKNDSNVKLVNLSRNFGKELATTAGINLAQGEATIIIDADGQHPPELIPDFISGWEGGAQVVVGVRSADAHESFIKKWGSKIFYRILSQIIKIRMVPASTDFRLIDREVREAFCRLDEVNRITRGLIDWLGFEVSYLEFQAKQRVHGTAAYSTKKLINLAVNTFVSLSFVPLYLSGYIGVAMTSLSLIGGLFIFIEAVLLSDPLGLNITSSGMLGLLTVFLVGLVLTSQGLTALYISRIYEEAKRRPLYVINKAKSIL